MSSETREKDTEYPYGRIRVYWSATIAILSAILALLMLREPIALLYYLVLTILLIVVVLAFKVRFVRARRLEPSEEGVIGNGNSSHTLRSVLILIVVLIVAMSLPLLLARFQPELWFISLISYTSSVSVAEVLFFLLAKRR